MKPVRVGVIGLGRMGKNHCRVYSSIREAELIGVCDIDPEVGRQVAETYFVSNFTNPERLLESVDAVSIATPTSSHLELVEKALGFGIPVLVEKPLAESLEEAQRICTISAESNLIVQVGHIERFNPVYREMKYLLAGMSVLALDFRRLSAFEGSNVDVDVVYDLMVHDTDLVLDLVGRFPDEVISSGISVMSGVLDHAVAQLRYEAGPLVSLTVSRVTEEKVRNISVTTLEAYIEADLLEKSLSANRRTIGEYLNFNREGVKYRQESIVERIHVPIFEPLYLELSHFLECVRGNKDCLVPAEDGLNALHLADIVRAKAMEGLISIPRKVSHVEQTPVEQVGTD